MNKKLEFLGINVPEQLELPFPKDKTPTNKETQDKKKEGVMVYALVPPFSKAL